MDFANVVLTWYSKIFRLYDSPVDMFSPVLAHLLLVYDPEEFSDELWINRYQFDQLGPDAEDLICHNLYVSSD